MDQQANAASALPLDEEFPIYRIAVSMSGAISAGAYTAGVFDFLIQALAELEYARRDPKHPDHGDVPKHYIPKIVALTGASAGGICTAVGTVGLGFGLKFDHDETVSSKRRPMRLNTYDLQATRIEGVLPGMYNAWVLRPRMVADKPPFLLSTEDVPNVWTPKKTLRSALNTLILDEIAKESLEPPSPPAPITQAPPYDFLFDQVHLYLTVTNLAGIQYDIYGGNPGQQFASVPYHMVNHADRVHYKIAGLGVGTNSPPGWADVDNGRALDVKDLPGVDGPSPGWRSVGQSALATSAFPVGLSARVLDDTLDDYKGIWFPAPDFDGAEIVPTFPQSYKDAKPPVRFGNVDGGVINNDPFDFARFAILEKWRDDYAANPREPAKADRSVIMISPFPEGKTVGDYAAPDTMLIKIVKLLAPTLLSQVRFKVDELAAAVDPTVASRWMIAPRRYDGDKPSSNYIACGALGGFGGFLDQKFREHDYMLGRRNCQAFLRWWTLSKFTEKAGLPVIPLVGSAKAPVDQLPWPKMTQADLAELMLHVRKRGDAVIPALLRQVLPCVVACLLSPLAKFVWHWKGVGAVRKAIVGNLAARGQLEPTGP